mgnify:CR=1 FL=1
MFQTFGQRLQSLTRGDTSIEFDEAVPWAARAAKAWQALAIRHQVRRVTCGRAEVLVWRPPFQHHSQGLHSFWPCRQSTCTL